MKSRSSSVGMFARLSLWRIARTFVLAVVLFRAIGHSPVEGKRILSTEGTEKHGNGDADFGWLAVTSVLMMNDQNLGGILRARWPCASSIRQPPLRFFAWLVFREFPFLPWTEIL